MRRSLLLVFLVACGSSVDLADYSKSAEDARCSYLVNCGLFTDQASCHAYFDSRTLQNPSVKAAVDAGKLSYDGEAASDCFDGLSSASCSFNADTPAACDKIFKGKIADGAACAFDAECISDSCITMSCSMACCPGMCCMTVPTPKIGQPCDFYCENGAYCASDSTCKALLPKGASCPDPDSCQAGFYCKDRSPTMAGICTALPKTGEACTDLCGDIGDTCKAGTCTPVGLLGDACMTDDDCSNYYKCDMATLKCIAPTLPTLMPNGSQCTSSTQCQSHYCGNDKLCADVPVCI